MEYFVSYYDYYQPEAYVPSSDTYIEKDSSINDEIDRLRHACTSSLLLRPDTIVVASVSCIYGLGSPDEYRDRIVALQPGEVHEQRALLRRLVELQYSRNDATLSRGASSGPGATPWRSMPPTRARPCASSSSATPSNASGPSTC